MVETAILLPLFLFGVLFFLWLAVTVNARNSLSSAIENGVRLAFSRGQGQLVGIRAGGLLSSVQNSLTGGSFNPPSGSPVTALLHRGNAPSPFGGGGWYMQEWRRTFGPSTNANDIPPHYVMALAQTYEGLVHSIGPSLRFPCDPRGAGPNNGPGCARCTNLHPMSIGDLNAAGRCEAGRVWAPPTSAGSGSCSGSPNLAVATLTRAATAGGEPFKLNWVGVECEYRPDNAILTPLLGLLQLLTGSAPSTQFVFTQRKFFETATTASGII